MQCVCELYSDCRAISGTESVDQRANVSAYNSRSTSNPGGSDLCAGSEYANDPWSSFDYGISLSYIHFAGLCPHSCSYSVGAWIRDSSGSYIWIVTGSCSKYFQRCPYIFSSEHTGASYCSDTYIDHLATDSVWSSVVVDSWVSFCRVVGYAYIYSAGLCDFSCSYTIGAWINFPSGSRNSNIGNSTCCNHTWFFFCSGSTIANLHVL
jgi:hypothetical protein